MNAMAEPQAFNLPKKPKIRQQEPPPDQRKLAVIPIRACTDPDLTLGMMRTLVLICSYMNRAGITWVSQARLATDLKVSQQAVSKHLVKLVKAGYLEVAKKPIPGQRMTTWRVIFDKSVDLETAIAVTSIQEDTRPPFIKEEQAAQETPDPEGQKRIAQLIRQALKSTKPTRKDYTMPEGNETMTVKKMKEEIAKTTKKKALKPAQVQPLEVVSEKPLAQPPEVVQPTDLHIQPPEVVNPTTSRGCAEHIFNNIYKDSSVLNNQQVERLKQAGMTTEQIRAATETLLPIYQAEGLTPTADLLADSILQLHRDTA